MLPDAITICHETSQQDRKIGRSADLQGNRIIERDRLADGCGDRALPEHAAGQEEQAAQ